MKTHHENHNGAAAVAVALALILAPVASFAQSGSDNASAPNKSSGAAAPAQPAVPETAAPAKPSATDTPAAPAKSDEAGNAPPAVPVKPGALRVTTRAPDPDKWDGQRSANGLQRFFKCKPLACSDQETVSFTFMKSPTRHPDPQALEKFAQIELPKSIRAANAAREVLSDGKQKIETLTSKTATLKNYPAVLNETKLSQGKVAIYLTTAIIFAGPAMIRVQSTSQNRDLAQKSLNEFVQVMRIEEGSTPQPGSPMPANGLQEQL
jgi:hypothetical protein